MSSLYELLDSHPQSSPEELKKSYRRLARQYHPDANPDDPAAEAKFKEISHAYEVLSDPERRAHYDRFGVDPSAGGGQGGGFDTGFGDIFEAFFGGMGGSAGRVRRGPQFGQDAEIRIGISLREACFGVERTLEVSLPVHCDDCQGTGAR
ncbi:MAG: DnaJ domain-containing protein, partial [Actinomycetes bacterium]